MKNTSENKEKFFSQYWGQQILCWTGDTSSHKYMIVGTSNLMNMDVLYLELKSLSQITDEDADFICGILTMSDFQLLTCEFGVDFENISCSYWDFIEVLDYLRSKGYLIPFMGLSTEKIIEYGWAKIKS